MLDAIVGRKKEIKVFQERMASKTSEFIALYGRRRIGKTYLVKQFFNQKPVIFFELTGLNGGSFKEQLKLFAESMSNAFYAGVEIATQDSWMAALQQLTNAIDSIPKNKRIVLFFDELPWLATRKSGFLNALDHYWNTRWTHRHKLMLIVCGSAASWMIDKLIYARGGLHNRITVTMPLQPFNLKETYDYFVYRGISLKPQQILELYMVVGGIPHYLGAITAGLSAAQTINALCFQKPGMLFGEFDKLFHSLYEEPEIYIQIIRVIAKKPQGLARQDLVKKLKKLTSGGRLNQKLKNLEEAGFISCFLPMGHSRKGLQYRIIDEYVLFFLTWIEAARHRGTATAISASHWQNILKTPAWYQWAGHAFESICFKHLEQIRVALGLQHLTSFCGNWRYLPLKNSEKSGAQIDLLFDRDDDCITLCEIKYSDKPFVITKAYYHELLNKQNVYEMQTKTPKQLFWAMITANGLVDNVYAKKLITKVVTWQDLFQ